RNRYAYRSQVLRYVLPVLAQEVAGPGKAKRPRKRAGKAEEREPPYIHSCDARGQANKGTYDREQAACKHSDLAIAPEPPVRDVELARRDQYPSPIALKEGATSPHPRVVRHQRTDQIPEPPEQSGKQQELVPVAPFLHQEPAG